MSLKARIAALIAAQGPISVAQFMTLALHDPKAGYYATRDGIGADFITAPEISQMFGEMVGLWLVQAWSEQGCPKNPLLVELGPGRGTLMADILRAAAVAPDFLKDAEVVMVEASPPLREAQQRKLTDSGTPITWQTQFKPVAGRPLFLVANEFFDALPIRQYVRTARGWCERMVTAAGDELSFALAPTPMPAAAMPESRAGAAEGSVYEIAPSAIVLAEDIAREIGTHGGAALLIDYGYDAAQIAQGFGETLQAVGGHAFADVLAAPGEDDLSAHVDFAALASAGRRSGAGVHGPMGQGEWLTALGIAARAESLMAKNPASATQLYQALERLIAPDKMGTLFQTLAFLPNAALTAPGFEGRRHEAA